MVDASEQALDCAQTPYSPIVKPYLLDRVRCDPVVLKVIPDSQYIRCSDNGKHKVIARARDRYFSSIDCFIKLQDIKFARGGIVAVNRIVARAFSDSIGIVTGSTV